jgi:hypothetical protein
MRARQGSILGALAIAALLGGSAFAGGADCHSKSTETAGHKHAHDAAACPLMKDVTKTSKMTDNGAVVTLTGKNEKAVKMIQEHLANHGKDHECAGCPVSMDGVSADININEKGGELTLIGSTPETIKAVQEWAAKPAGGCCSGKKTAA